MPPIISVPLMFWSHSQLRLLLLQFPLSEKCARNVFWLLVPVVSQASDQMSSLERLLITAPQSPSFFVGLLSSHPLSPPNILLIYLSLILPILSH